MKLLLINAINSEAPDRLHPPLGLAYLASSLRKEFGNGIECKIIDGNLTGNIKSFNPDIVGITSVSRNYNVAKGYASIAKQAALPVIIGGVHISVLPETITKDMNVVVIGEGEETIRGLIALFMETGLFGRQIAESKDLIKPLDSIPFPARDLLKIGKHASMITSRGCPYNCVFCSTSRNTRNQVRYHSAEYVVTEMEMIFWEYKPEYITIYDDLFAMDAKRVIKIQELMAAKNLIGKFNLAVNIRTDFITDELAEVLRDMNVKAVGLGVESGCQRTLDYLKSGGITVEDNARATRILRRYHILPYCTLIIGSPDEDMDSVLQTLKFIKDNKIEHYDINVLIPFPGTPVWDYALSRGLVSNDMDWSKLDYHFTANPIILSEKISRQEIEAVLTKVETKRKRAKKRRSMMNIIKHPYKYIVKPNLKRFQ